MGYSFGSFLKKWWKPIVAVVASVVTYGAASGWAASWVAGAGLGGTVTGGALAGAIGGAASGFVGGAVGAALNGGNLRQVLTGSFGGALTGAAIGGVLGAFSPESTAMTVETETVQAPPFIVRGSPVSGTIGGSVLRNVGGAAIGGASYAMWAPIQRGGANSGVPNSNDTLFGHVNRFIATVGGRGLDDGLAIALYGLTVSVRPASSVWRIDGNQ
jgi:hypothetical protein